MRGVESLHLHTHSSDGQFSHEEALDIAAKNGIGVIAFTDHDAIPGPKVAQKLFSLKDHETKWIMGIELSSGLPSELGSGATSDFHIVGLGVNPFDKNLREHCQIAQESRIERMEYIVGNLRNLGFEITTDDCLRASDGESVGRPHIVTALKLSENARNAGLLLDLKERMRVEAHHNTKIRQMYDLMMSRGAQQYPYILFLSSDAFIPGIYTDSRYWVDLDQTVSFIRNAAGLAIVAHYWTAIRKVSPELLETLLITNRLDGAETVFGLWEYVNKSTNLGLINEAHSLVRELVVKHNKLATGGADIHRVEDYEEFGKAVWYSQETIGMGRNVVNRLDKSNPWHSLST